MRHPGEFTYRLRATPPVPPVLSFLQRHADIDDREAYGTFNMEAGFALFVRADQAEAAVQVSQAQGIEAWVAGAVEAGPKRVVVEPLGIEYGSGGLHLRG